MKSAAFTHHAVEGVEAAADLLAEHGAEARVLAGGQSLVPLMHRRIERPGHLVDINRIEALRLLDDDGDQLRIGAGTRQREVELSAAAAARWPLLGEALAEVAHPAIRNRGTVVGSLCHADPSAELPSVAMALGGSVLATASGGSREIALADFFLAPGRTALREDEVAVELRVPAPSRGTGTAWLELARRAGDLPVAGAAAAVSLDDRGRCRSVRCCCANAATVPYDCAEQLRPLSGEALDEEAAASVGAAVAAACDPVSDYQGSAAERRRVLAVLVRRALLSAAGRAGGEGA